MIAFACAHTVSLLVVAIGCGVGRALPTSSTPILRCTLGNFQREQQLRWRQASTLKTTSLASDDNAGLCKGDCPNQNSYLYDIQ